MHLCVQGEGRRILMPRLGDSTDETIYRQEDVTGRIDCAQPRLIIKTSYCEPVTMVDTWPRRLTREYDIQESFWVSMRAVELRRAGSRQNSHIKFRVQR